MDKHWENLSENLKLSEESRERIRAQLATQPIQQEVISKKKALYLRAPLVAAALTAALVVTALAVELTVGWENFLGHTPKEAVTSVGVSAVTGDYTLTLQESIVDKDGAALLLALTRNDGGVLEGEPTSGEITTMRPQRWREFPTPEAPADLILFFLRMEKPSTTVWILSGTSERRAWRGRLSPSSVMAW